MLKLHEMVDSNALAFVEIDDAIWVVIQPGTFGFP